MRNLAAKSVRIDSLPPAPSPRSMLSLAQDVFVGVQDTLQRIDRIESVLFGTENGTPEQETPYCVAECLNASDAILGNIEDRLRNIDQALNPNKTVEASDTKGK